MKAASSVDIPFQKPLRSVTSMFLGPCFWLNPLCVAFSSTLEETADNETDL